MDNELERIINEIPSLREAFAKMAYRSANPKFKFPGGFRWRYFGKLELFTGIWGFCWSTTRNEHKKFISWVYMPEVGKKRWLIKKALEHRKMKDAKARVLKMYYQHKDVQDKYEALFNKRQRKGKK